MSQERRDYTNKGVLFINDRKQSDKSPDYTGKININGEELVLAGWKKTSQKGDTFLSLSVKKMEWHAPPGNTTTGKDQAPAAAKKLVWAKGEKHDALEEEEIPF